MDNKMLQEERFVLMGISALNLALAICTDKEGGASIEDTLAKWARLLDEGKGLALSEMSHICGAFQHWMSTARELVRGTEMASPFEDNLAFPLIRQDMENMFEGKKSLKDRHYVKFLHHAIFIMVADCCTVYNKVLIYQLAHQREYNLALEVVTQMLEKDIKTLFLHATNLAGVARFVKANVSEDPYPLLTTPLPDEVVQRGIRTMRAVQDIPTYMNTAVS
jgi:hypothetical protein